VARTIESVGDIETICKTEPAKAGEEIRLVFPHRGRPRSALQPQGEVAVGQVILERVIRDLPTGLPQSAPP